MHVFINEMTIIGFVEEQISSLVNVRSDAEGDHKQAKWVAWLVVLHGVGPDSP